MFHLHKKNQKGRVLLANNDVMGSWSENKFSRHTGEQQKLSWFSDNVMEEQPTCFICITYQGKPNGSVLLTNEWFTEQLEWTQILPMTKCTGEQQNSQIKYGGMIHMFHLYNLPRKQNGMQWTVSKRRMYEVVGTNTKISPIQKLMYTGHSANITKNCPNFWMQWWRNYLYVSLI